MFDRPQGGAKFSGGRTARAAERAVLVRLGVGTRASEQDLSEFTALAVSAGAVPVATIGGYRRHPDPRLFVGSGKAEQIRAAALQHDADLVLFDHPLKPSQERNLEQLIERRVLDRSGLILDIFAQRARSHEGKLEVELAQLKHMATRLVRGWTHLERQKGGIGLRGPGETQLETDRRLLANRIRTVSKRLEKVQRQRDTSRKSRREAPMLTVALVGYTNAGKSTLFNALTGAGAYVADQLFATLDPTVRRLRLPQGQTVVLADTVGFVRDLPHELVAAFRSTLQETREASLLLHVVDAGDPQRLERIAQVNEVLDAIDVGDIAQIEVFNKIDSVAAAPPMSEEGVVRVGSVGSDGAIGSAGAGGAGPAGRVWVSALKGIGLEQLRSAIGEHMYRGAQATQLQ